MMSQPSLFPAAILTVSQITLRIRRLLEGDMELQDVWVEGEISNLSRPASGHIYFTLKDKIASLRCVMWKADHIRSRPNLQEGMAVKVHGRIAVYEPQGQYQLIATIIRPRGEGELYQEFTQLKARLEAEGLFDEARKRPIPSLPHLIGIVTSPSGAALRDMLHTLSRRLPLLRVILCPAPVQGVEAPHALVEAIEAVNRHEPDVILLGRGGGSMEDLWAFNNENLVRAVAASRAPVITGVGHETDFTLCDFAADLRAPTPTAAAELATPVTLADLGQNLQETQVRFAERMLIRFAEWKGEVTNLSDRLRYVSPERGIQIAAQQLDELARRAWSAASHEFQIRMENLNGSSRRLLALNPQGVLARGYAIISRKEDGVIVSRVGQARGAMIVRVSDGEFEVKK